MHANATFEVEPRRVTAYAGDYEYHLVDFLPRGRDAIEITRYKLTNSTQDTSTTVYIKGEEVLINDSPLLLTPVQQREVRFRVALFRTAGLNNPNMPKGITREAVVDFFNTIMLKDVKGLSRSAGISQNPA